MVRCSRFGGHIQCYCDSEWYEGETCTACRMVTLAETHPLYIRDEDDDFDTTYATYYFRFPEGTDLEGIEPDGTTPKDRWEALFKALDEMKKES